MNAKDREKVEGQDKPGEEPQKTREYASIEDIQNAVKSGELDANAVLADLAELENEDQPGEETQPGENALQDDAGGKPRKEDVNEEDKPVQMTVRPSWLKAGSSQYKDVESMSKGVAEKDRYIEQLKTARADLETRLGKTTAEYQQTLAQVTELKKTAKPGSKAVLPDLSKLPDLPELSDDDLFDENKRKAYLTAAKERDSMLHKAIESMQKQVEDQKPADERAPENKGGKAPEQQQAAPQAYDPSIEFNEIEQFRKSPGLEKLFGGDRDIRDVESDYISFMEKLGGIANVAVYDDAGRFTQSIRDAFQLYQNPTTETGKKFRDLCEAKNFGLPEEMPVLERVYAVRRVRNSMRTPDGKPIPYVDAYPLAKSKTPDIFNEATDPRDALVKQHEAEERVAQGRQRFAKETPAGASSGADPGEMSMAQFDRLLKKPVAQYTPKEMEMYVGVLKSKGMTDEEIQELIPSQGG